jgi:hypothetical protein
VSGQLVEGTKWTEAEVRTALSDFGTAVQRIGENMTMDKGSTSATSQSAGSNSENQKH